MALYILGVCWHESAFIFSSLQKEGNKLQYDEDSFFLPLSLFLFIQKTDSSALHAVYVYCFFLLPGALRVYLTGGNQSGLTGYRSNRSGPVPVSAGTQSAKIQNLNLNSKNKKFLKILQVAMNLMVSNFLTNSFI